MQTYTLTEAKAKFSEVVEKAMKGEEIIVTKMGEPAVQIKAYQPQAKTPLLGMMKGEITMSDDFDEWPEDIARSLGIID